MNIAAAALTSLIAMVSLPGIGEAADASQETDRATVAALDVQYQAAVKINDADTMARILDERFALVLGNGTTHTRDDLLKQARAGTIQYEMQDEVPGTQTVRLFGDTATVTALLELKYTYDEKKQERRLWFSDTYVRTPAGWKYVFGQASIALPADG